jgi:hypothetical protein
MDPQNQRAPFHLPLLHTLVEERVGERRFLLRFMGLRWGYSAQEPPHPALSSTCVEERGFNKT